MPPFGLCRNATIACDVCVSVSLTGGLYTVPFLDVLRLPSVGRWLEYYNRYRTVMAN